MDSVHEHFSFYLETSLANYVDSLEWDVYLSASFNKAHGVR